jgi:hypothetical protein
VAENRPPSLLAAPGRARGEHTAVVLLACGQVEPANRRGHVAHDRSPTDGQLAGDRAGSSVPRPFERQSGMNMPLSLRPAAAFAWK